MMKLFEQEDEELELAKAKAKSKSGKVKKSKITVVDPGSSGGVSSTTGGEPDIRSEKKSYPSDIKIKLYDVLTLNEDMYITDESFVRAVQTALTPDTKDKSPNLTGNQYIPGWK